MTDSEVGELWKRHIDNHDYYEEHLAEEIIDLVLKLIEERAKALYYASVNAREENFIYVWELKTAAAYYYRNHYTREACADFSIPYDEYLKAKEHER